LAMSLLDRTDILKIEDILPFFPDFMVIDNFKEEVCGALESYAGHIHSLKVDMDQATSGAEDIKADIHALQHRFITIDTAENCAHCSLPLMSRQFYAFPCQHALHVDCLIHLAKEFLPSHALRQILHLQTSLIHLSSTVPTDLSAMLTPALVPVRHSRRTLLSMDPDTALHKQPKLTGSFGQNILAARDKLRDLVLPEPLATLATTSIWPTGLDKVSLGLLGGSKAEVPAKEEEARGENAQRVLDTLLTASCPLCESLVVRVDKQFERGGSGMVPGT